MPRHHHKSQRFKHRTLGHPPLLYTSRKYARSGILCAIAIVNPFPLTNPGHSSLIHEKLPTRRFWDRLLLVSSAIAVCIVGVSAFLLADNYKLNPAWIVFAVNSIGFIAVVGRKFRSCAKTLPFITFLAIWLAFHSAVMVALTAWVPVPLWLPLIAIELFAGYLVARQLFGVPPNRNVESQGTPVRRVRPAQ